MKKTLAALFLALCLCPACASAASSKKASPTPPAQEKDEFGAADAIALAESFVAEQGYTALPAKVSKDTLAPDPLDASKDPDIIAKSRRNTLEPKAVGSRFDSDLWFVGFRSRSGGRIRAVRMDAEGLGLKMISQSIQPDWLSGNDPKPEPIDKAMAAGIAKRFVENQEARGLAKEPSKVEEHKPDDKDAWEAWWFYFPKAGLAKKTDLRPGDYALVSVHKLSREPKWVVEFRLLTPKPVPPAKPVAKPTTKPTAKPVAKPTAKPTAKPAAKP
ncbi:MAG: hypothetical protein WC943_10870 [Elusimicrobiota bacterium]|jgi:hypothetical protein